MTVPEHQESQISNSDDPLRNLARPTHCPLRSIWNAETRLSTVPIISDGQVPTLEHLVGKDLIGRWVQ